MRVETSTRGGKLWKLKGVARGASIKADERLKVGSRVPRHVLCRRVYQSGPPTMTGFCKQLHTDWIVDTSCRVSCMQSSTHVALALWKDVNQFSMMLTVSSMENRFELAPWESWVGRKSPCCRHTKVTSTDCGSFILTYVTYTRWCQIYLNVRMWYSTLPEWEFS